jgi:carbohydrate-selective porin OprB
MLRLDWGLNQQYGDQIEFEHEHSIAGQPGALRFLLFQNRGWMASYSTAMNLAAQNNLATPDILASRNSYQKKWGYGVNLEQAITDTVGLFARWSWNDGQTETQAFTDIDRSLSAGFVVNGTHWGRENDTWGIAGAANGIAGSQIAYLTQGGSTMFIGDGKLNYGRERILETYYSFNLCKGAYLSADYQFIANPAYNADRGPVSFYGIRAHFEL